MRKIRTIRDFSTEGHSPSVVCNATALPSPSGEGKGAAAFPTDYNGTPYSVIVNGLLCEFGFPDGKVPEGARNTTLYRLARQLRYITNFNAAFLRSVVPDWGLPQEEVQQTVLSAVNSQRAQDFPAELKKAIEGITKPDLSTTRKRQEYLRRLNPLPEKMPWLLQYIYQRYGRNGRAALATALPMLGMLLGRMESAYCDGRKHRPVFMVVVCGRAGSGKGFIGDMQDWLLAPIMADDEDGREELKEYNLSKEKKKGVKELGEKPNPCIRILNATSSNGFLMERAQASLSQPLLVVTEEIDESARANKNGAWADKSDIYRKAFDGALWGKDYMTYSGSVHLYVNLVFAGTFVSVRNYFSNVENGLMTRFFFVEMANDRGQNVQMAPERVSANDRRAVREVKRLYELGCTTEIPAPEYIITIALPHAKEDAYNFNAEKIAEWEQSGDTEEERDPAIDLLRRRSAVTLFRASQVCWALERNRETKVGRNMAQWYANEMYLNQYIMFADAIRDVDRENTAVQKKQDLAASRMVKSSVLHSLVVELPQEFRMKDLELLLTGKGKNASSARTYVSRMMKAELVAKMGDKYKRILEV